MVCIIMTLHLLFDRLPMMENQEAYIALEPLLLAERNRM